MKRALNIGSLSHLIGIDGACGTGAERRTIRGRSNMNKNTEERMCRTRLEKEQVQLEKGLG